MPVLDLSLHPGQAQVHQSAAKHKRVFAGRGWGKDHLARVWLLTEAAALAEARDPSPNLQPHVHDWYVAPNYGITTPAWLAFKGMLPKEIVAINPATRRPWIHDTPPYSVWLDLTGGPSDERRQRLCLVEFKSGDDPDSLRGPNIDHCVVTESAFLSEESWGSLRMTLIRPGRIGKSLLISTPKGKNWGWREWKRGRDFPDAPHDEGYESWQFSALDNPLLTDEQRREIEAERKARGERWFNQEILAEAVDMAGKAIDPDAVDECAVGEFEEPDDDATYTAGVDYGRYDDPTVNVIGDPERMKIVRIESLRGASPERTGQWVATLLERYGEARAWVDRTAIGEALLTQLRLHSVNHEPVHFNAQTKPKMVEALIGMIEARRIILPKHPEMIRQLKELEYEQSDRSGYVKYAAPKSDHDDIVMALALWTESVPKERPSVMFLDEDFIEPEGEESDEEALQYIG